MSECDRERIGNKWYQSAGFAGKDTRSTQGSRRKKDQLYHPDLTRSSQDHLDLTGSEQEGRRDKEERFDGDRSIRSPGE